MASTNRERPNVRAATASDGAAIVALLTASGLPTAGVHEMLTHDATQFLVAHDAQGALVAMAGVEECGGYGLLRSVAVHTDWQRHGLGQQLIAGAIAQAESRRLQALYLLTLTAEGYFPRFGFERIAREHVPPSVAATVEFASACPASAVAMCRPLAVAG